MGEILVPMDTSDVINEAPEIDEIYFGKEHETLSLTEINHRTSKTITVKALKLIQKEILSKYSTEIIFSSENHRI